MLMNFLDNLFNQANFHVKSLLNHNKYREVNPYVSDALQLKVKKTSSILRDFFISKSHVMCAFNGNTLMLYWFSTVSVYSPTLNSNYSSFVMRITNRYENSYLLIHNLRRQKKMRRPNPERSTLGSLNVLWEFREVSSFV